MIVLDTCAIIFDALEPQRLSVQAQDLIDQADQQSQLYFCEISLWEIAMLIKKNRLSVSLETEAFLNLLLNARNFIPLGITPSIATLSTSDLFHQKDPADRIIASTAIAHHATLITTDAALMALNELTIIS